CLDDDLQARLAEFRHEIGNEGHPALAGGGFFGDRDDHGYFSLEATSPGTAVWAKDRRPPQDRDGSRWDGWGRAKSRNIVEPKGGPGEAQSLDNDHGRRSFASLDDGFDSGQLFGAAWDCNRKAKARRTQKASQRSDWQHQKKRKDLLQRRFAPGFQWPLCGSASLLRPTRRTFIARSFIVSAYILHPRVA